MDRQQQAIYGTHVTDDQQATVIATRGVNHGSNVDSLLSSI
jgi:hypothetical protein